MSDIEMTSGFFLLASIIARHISSDALTSPPGESMRTSIPSTCASAAASRSSLAKP